MAVPGVPSLGRNPSPDDFDRTSRLCLPAPLVRPHSPRAARPAVGRPAGRLRLGPGHLSCGSHQAAARRLIERPMITEDPYAIWPYHLHGALRTALRTADDRAEDRWPPADWHRAADPGARGAAPDHRTGRHRLIRRSAAVLRRPSTTPIAKAKIGGILTNIQAFQLRLGPAAPARSWWSALSRPRGR